MVKKDHLKDIDFRTREVRQLESIPEMISWYKELHQRQEEKEYDAYLNGQSSMLSSVLWYLLPKKDYKKLTKLKK